MSTRRRVFMRPHAQFCLFAGSRGNLRLMRQNEAGATPSMPSVGLTDCEPNEAALETPDSHLRPATRLTTNLLLRNMSKRHAEFRKR